MEDHRDDLIVILAGYSKEMAEFLTANSGLKSRFPNIIEFPDYTGEELLAIAKLQAGGKGYTLDERCDANLLAYFNAVQLTRGTQATGGWPATKWRRPSSTSPAALWPSPKQTCACCCPRISSWTMWAEYKQPSAGLPAFL